MKYSILKILTNKEIIIQLQTKFIEAFLLIQILRKDLGQANLHKNL